MSLSNHVSWTCGRHAEPEVTDMASLPIVYSIRGCPACARLLEQWDAEGIAYEERRADLSQEAMDEARKLGDAVPIVVYPDGRVERRLGGRRGCYIG